MIRHRICNRHHLGQDAVAVPDQHPCRSGARRQAEQDGGTVEMRLGFAVGLGDQVHVSLVFPSDAAGEVGHQQRAGLARDVGHRRDELVSGWQCEWNCTGADGR